ncbi:MAG TPA: hypothetical protein VGC55_03385 [Dokdonella sp.]
MSLDPRLHNLRRAAAQRRLAITALCVPPPALAACVLAARMGGRYAAALAAIVALALSAARMWRALRSVDATWLARRLDAISPRMDDSAALLFRDDAALSTLQRLQQARLRTRLADVEGALLPSWPWRRVALAVGAAVAILAIAASWQPSSRALVDTGSSTPAAVRSSTTALAQVRLHIEAPAYTGVAARDDATLETKAPEGSRIQWTLRFDASPQAVALVFHDGSRIALDRSGDTWSGEHRLIASTLYRIVLDGAPPLADDRLYRLDAIADRAPEVRVVQPEKTLTLLDAQQKTWDLAFEASDDYAIARADLSITLAQGTGENITFKEQTLALSGEPLDAQTGMKAQRYRHTLDLAALGIAAGDDVVVKLAVSDNREPKPNTTRSASFILRWPVAASSESAGMEGIVQKTMPAYFRSQRQIILDTEALIADTPQLDEAKRLARSDAIGVDQKILRLRYGQFLGEESESHAEHDDEHAHVAAPAGKSFNEALHDSKAEAQVDALAEAHAAHERSTPAAPAKFGQEGNTVAEYGHVHDIAEAATLLDPETKATLKSALAEMWQSELNLRQGKPDEALPYERRALDSIKQVQQSTRIYLARVGLELPVPDEARRLSGERKDLADRVGTLAAASGDAAVVVDLWRGLATAGTPDWDAAEAWVRARESTLPDALAVLAAIDRARRDATCAECRVQLRNLVWPLLPVPATSSAPRTAADAAGRAYLDALHERAVPAAGAAR